MAAIELHRADMVSGMIYAPEVGGYVRIIIQYRDRGGGVVSPSSESFLKTVIE